MDTFPQWFGRDQFSSIAVAVDRPTRHVKFAPLAIEDWDDLYGARVCGLIRLRNTNTGLIFYTSKKNIFKHFKSQIYKLKARTCCPSWTNAITEQQLEFDWDEIHFLAVAKNQCSALRLKLATVDLFPDCFNERFETFSLITDGREEYIESITALNFQTSTAQYESMLKIAAKANNPFINDEMEKVDLLQGGDDEED